MSKPATILKRRAFLINFFYFAIIIMLFYLFMHYAFWITFPFLAAFAIAMFLQRPVGFITRKTPIKRGFASVIMVILLLLAFLGPISLLIAKIISEFMGFFDYTSGNKTYIEMPYQGIWEAPPALYFGATTGTFED